MTIFASLMVGRVSYHFYHMRQYKLIQVHATIIIAHLWKL